jgi:hypothetical protein
MKQAKETEEYQKGFDLGWDSLEEAISQVCGIDNNDSARYGGDFIKTFTIAWRRMQRRIRHLEMVAGVEHESF